MHTETAIFGFVADAFIIGSLIYAIVKFRSEHTTSQTPDEVYSKFNREKLLRQSFFFLVFALLVSAISTAIMAFNAFGGEERTIDFSFIISKLLLLLFSIWLIRASRHS